MTFESQTKRTIIEQRKENIKALKKCLEEKLRTELDYLETDEDLDTVTKYDFSEYDHMRFMAISKLIQRLINSEPVEQGEVRMELEEDWHQKESLSV